MDQFYLNKYFKYKQKYLNLKEIIQIGSAKCKICKKQGTKCPRCDSLYCKIHFIEHNKDVHTCKYPECTELITKTCSHRDCKVKYCDKHLDEHMKIHKCMQPECENTTTSKCTKCSSIYCEKHLFYHNYNNL